MLSCSGNIFVGSVGIQIGGISAIAPARRSDFARLGIRVMVGGVLASWMTATIAGLLLYLNVT